MPCYYPIRAYRAKSGRQPNGKWPVVFNLRDGYEDLPVDLPCGRCIGCKLEYSKKWAVRCVHEASLYEKNVFLTLTYNDENLPYASDGQPTLVKRDFQLFMKRLRKKYGNGIRFYACGEYGEKYQRPHYHLILFNFSPPDLRVIQIRSYPLYTSEGLSSVWNLGFHTIGDVNFESSAYVARYILKKNNLKDYGLREKEFVLMSRRPGIASDWFDKNKNDVYPLDAVFIQRNGKLIKMKPPRYYDNKFELFSDESLQTFMKVKRRRKYYSERNVIKVSELEGMARVSKIKLERKLRSYERSL
nr:MAG: replication initiator protein [Microvirus sp.]